MLTELRKVIPSFLVRVDRADRGGAWSAYLETNRKAMEHVASALLEGVEAEDGEAPIVRLVDHDPDGEDKVVAAMLYPYSHASEEAILRSVERMSVDDKLAVVRAYAGERTNRRHKPGRALERTMYRFDVLSDYGAFRDLQRHRMLTIEWQSLSPRHGYSLPEAVVEAGVGATFEEAMERSAALHGALEGQFGEAQAGYAVALAYRIRYVMEMNARSALHLIELRSGPQGHPEYRRVAQEMHRLIRDEAGHHAIAELMSFVDYGTYDLERLDAERRMEAKRLSRS
jgi:hypothetical protein